MCRIPTYSPAGVYQSAVVIILAALSIPPVHADSPFAVRVVEYAPAPGQFVNVPEFNDPSRALGAPVGGGTAAADNSSVVSLGGFGGYIVLAFDRTVTDHPLNPMGLDAIVFSNSFWAGGNPQRRWAECATIEIALDRNGNGLPDEDQWYLIPGSHIVDPFVQFTQQTWDDNIADATFPPALSSWLPPGRTGAWTTSAYMLQSKVFGQAIVQNPDYPLMSEGIFGYAGYSPTLRLGDMSGNNLVVDHEITPEAFYIVPDNPFEVGITPGSGGGDAFDMAWAIDPATGEPANLHGFDFIRLTNGVNFVQLPFGEWSPEIDAVAIVRPDFMGDADGNGLIDLRDIQVLQTCLADAPTDGATCSAFVSGDGVAPDFWDALFVIERMTGPN
jgi:hypothetical protein